MIASGSVFDRTLPAWHTPGFAVGTNLLRTKLGRAAGRVQDDAMREHFPTMKRVIDLPWLTVWEGEIRPVSATYRVRVTDQRGCCDENILFPAQWPTVRVLSPSLMTRPESPATPVPHLYGSHDDVRGASLCLFYPADREWNDDMLIAKSIVPWSAEWLFYYEMWQVTGEWGGPEAPHNVGFVQTPVLCGRDLSRHRAIRPIDAPVMRNMLYAFAHARRSATETLDRV